MPYLMTPKRHWPVTTLVAANHHRSPRSPPSTRPRQCTHTRTHATTNGRESPGRLRHGASPLPVDRTRSTPKSTPPHVSQGCRPRRLPHPPHPLPSRRRAQEVLHDGVHLELVDLDAAVAAAVGVDVRHVPVGSACRKRWKGSRPVLAGVGCEAYRRGCSRRCASARAVRRRAARRRPRPAAAAPSSPQPYDAATGRHPSGPPPPRETPPRRRAAVGPSLRT